MSSTTHQIWLHRLFNSPYFDTWMAVSYLHRYPTTGIHRYICGMLEYRRDIEKVLPQLVHILFYNTDDIVSFPILNLLVKKSRVNRRLSAALFFYLKSYLELLPQKKRFYCEYLISIILDVNKMNRRPLFLRSLKQRHTYLKHKVRVFLKSRTSFTTLGGILVYFVKATGWSVSYEMAKKLDGFENIFKVSRDLEVGEPSLNIERFSLESNFKKSITFLNELVDITARLRHLPKHIQQKGLEVEVQQLQLNLPAKISIPFYFGYYVLNICAEHSFVLDSASNSPFVMVLEVAKEIKGIERKLGSEIRTAIFLLKQLASSSEQTPAEVKTIKERIMERLVNINKRFPLKGISWDQRKKIIESSSPFSRLKGYKIVSFIVKSGTDFKKEVVAYQLLTEIKKIWEEEEQRPWIKNYKIYLVGSDSGIVETMTNVCSIHAIKKKNSGRKNFTLGSYYEETFNDIEKAKDNFLRSLVGYSLVTFFLQVKDRHNGNIMVDSNGHIIHVDFGFIMGEHPGFYNVEKAPFKFSSEYIELLGNNLDSFKKLFKNGFLALRKYSERLCRIVEMLMENSQLRCINRSSFSEFRDRFKLDLCNQDVERYAMNLVDLSMNSKATGFYDQFQYYSNGYL